MRYMGGYFGLLLLREYMIYAHKYVHDLFTSIYGILILNYVIAFNQSINQSITG